jgi:flagellin-like protein
MFRRNRFCEDRTAVSPVIATILMVGITIALAGVLVVYMPCMCCVPYSSPTNSTIYFQSEARGNDRVLTVVHVNGAGGDEIYLERSVVQIICGNSHNVVVQFPSSGTGIGVGDVKHFEFHEVHNVSWLRTGDYFVVHICDNVHNGDIFRVLDGNVTAGETRLL